MARFRRAWMLALVLLTVPLAGCLDQDPSGSPAPGPRDQVTGGIVVAAHEDAADAGARMLELGGNAFDAAVATQFALNVVEPHFSGIGGGAFILAYLAEADRLIVIDAREVAPASTTSDMYADPVEQEHDRQGYSVGVPGTLAGMDRVLARHGRLDLATTLQPAIGLADQGFEVYPSFSDAIEDNAEELRSWPPSARLFLEDPSCPGQLDGCIGGSAPEPGTTFTNPDLAATLSTLAQDGPDVFYNGTIGQAIVDTVTARDGGMTLEDLAGYRTVDRAPIGLAYGDHQVVTMPPPGGGTVVLQALGMVEPMDLSQAGAATAQSLHLTLEALKLAYADRAVHVADPAFVDVPTQGLIHPGYLDERRELIDPDQANSDPSAGDPWAYQEDNGSSEAGSPDDPLADAGRHTTHFVAADDQGNVVSITSTIESYFGTGMVVPGHGFLLNDELTDFSWSGQGPNKPEPGKRPRSSMSPTIVMADGRPVMAVGSPGGTTIPSTVAEVLLNVLEHGQGLETAVEAGRQFPASYPAVAFDRGMDPEARSGLMARGHVPYDDAGGYSQGNVHAILAGPDDGWTGWADTRRGQGGVAVVQGPGSSR